jgi:hypothetical protein
MPELVRDVLDYTLSLRGDSPVVDIVGTNENSDLALVRTATGFRVAIINYNASDMEVRLHPIEQPVIPNGKIWLLIRRLEQTNR